ncbi:fatty acid-binding protein, brain-like [Neoarius graeffei]|uniref:fatty acid-binding protein, brain-like n=1 Tax=Neoarius graeffei TaxID=443677 RepID=UPI00298BDE6B|nr:fatty acid-binding protein, brain-like [Neoarius graeffei]
MDAFIGSWKLVKNENFDMIMASTMNLEGEKLIHVRLYEGFELTTVWEIQDGKLISTMICDDVTAVRTYEKV